MLGHPSVASKLFLITIGDRSVGGLTHRDQCVGPWQVPVADCAITLNDFSGYSGQAMACGERSPVAVLDAPASGRLAVAEAITNIAAAPIAYPGDIKLSANWMAASGLPGEDARLYATVQAVSELCIALGIAIPVGKDSLSMQTTWSSGKQQACVHAPVSVVISAFAPLIDVRSSLDPVLARESGTELMLLDLGDGHAPLGGSILAQCYGCLGNTVADVRDPEALLRLFGAVQELRAAGLLMAYHDRSDGGLLAAVCEMAFAGRCGVELRLEPAVEALPQLFSETVGTVVQYRIADRARVAGILDNCGLPEQARHVIGRPNAQHDRLRILHGKAVLADVSMQSLLCSWHATSHAMQRLRDNPRCADAERDAVTAWDSAGITASPRRVAARGAPAIATGARPRVAIFREQGVNGHIEMAAAFFRAGFDCVDVHCTDLQEARIHLDGFVGLVACGGFSYGDVLGAGRGWAAAILHDSRLRDQFEGFFARTDRFSLGVCNGCQMLSYLRDLIPGAEAWPRFLRNESEQFEARLSRIEVLDSPSVLLTGMQGSMLPVVVSHGEGRAMPNSDQMGIPCLRFVTNAGDVAYDYPANPNGSSDACTGFCTSDGRSTIMMPHPERVFRQIQLSAAARKQEEFSAWFSVFQNARRWVD